MLEILVEKCSLGGNGFQRIHEIPKEINCDPLQVDIQYIKKRNYLVLMRKKELEF